MNRMLRVVLSLALGALACFSIFGFMATFEPIDPTTRMTWRVIYVILFLASNVGLIIFNLPRKNNRTDD
ncbi:MAG: hypothetical protein VCA55_04525 [Verrucomicrobiales bacterium]